MSLRDLRPAARQALLFRAPGAEQEVAPEPPAGDMLAWFQYGVGITSSGGLVSAWADQAGNNYHATEAGASKPALNADGSIAFVAGKKLTAGGVGTRAQPLSVCVKMRPTAALSTKFFGGAGGACLRGSSGTSIKIEAGGSAVGTQAFTEDEWISVVVVFNGASSILAASPGNVETGLNPGSEGFTDGAGLSFNDPSFFGGDGWDAAEAILYSRALSAAEVTQALEYLDSIPAGDFASFSTEYTTPGTQTVAIPDGAHTVTVETYAAGATPKDDGTGDAGGGGAYSKRNTYNVEGLTGLYMSIPDAPAGNTAGGDCFVKENSSGGNTICLAKGGGSGGVLRTGGAAGSGVGDVKNSGGNGETYGSGLCGGGGGAGPTGNGGNGSGGSGGVAGGGLSGAGGEGTGDPGVAAGGGGGSRDDIQGGAGARGAVKLSWA